MKTSTQGACRDSFTLVELLVVIAIIAVLASLLLPALRRTMDLAKQASCANSLSQLGRATALYITDFDEYIPPACDDDIGNRGQFFVYIGQYLDYRGTGWRNSYADKVEIQKQKGVIWGCPIWNREEHIASRCGYGMNCHPMWPTKKTVTTNGYQTWQNYRLVKLNEIRFPHNREMIGDSHDWHHDNMFAEGVLPDNEKIYRHNKQSNHVFFDFHVETVHYTRVLEIFQDPGNEI